LFGFGSPGIKQDQAVAEQLAIAASLVERRMEGFDADSDASICEQTSELSK